MSRFSASTDDINTRDRGIMARLAHGETEAAADLYKHYGRLVFSIIYKVIQNTAVAEDLVQDVFVRAWKAAATYRPELGSVRAWLVAIAHHRAVDEWRHRRKESDWLILDETVPDKTAEESPSDPFVYRALQELPAEQRQVIELAYFHGLTMSEIAARLKLAPGTVKSRARLALVKLRALLDVEQERDS
jgi:RNA polymerase sigma-70 factor, ECF subfamily